MKKQLLSILSLTIIAILLSSCGTPPPEGTKFNYGSDDPYRQGQNLVDAIAHGSYSAAYRLMEAGAPLNYQDKKDEWTPLIYAIYYERWSIGRVLIRAGANVNLPDSVNRTPLMWAAMRNAGTTTKLLVEYGADINAVDLSGRTALQYAIIYDNNSIAAFLAEAGRLPTKQQMKKEQFDRLEFKRAKEAAEAKNLELFGTKRERDVIANLKREDINKDVAVDVKPAGTAAKPAPAKTAPAPAAAKTAPASAAGKTVKTPEKSPAPVPEKKPAPVPEKIKQEDKKEPAGKIKINTIIENIQKEKEAISAQKKALTKPAPAITPVTPPVAKPAAPPVAKPAELAAKPVPAAKPAAAAAKQAQKTAPATVAPVQETAPAPKQTSGPPSTITLYDPTDAPAKPAGDKTK
ncbi:MAG: ankyrin repeat domain-containing protein [Victivallales bacterium]